MQNRLAYFSDGNYDYIGLLDTNDAEGKEIWAGMNSSGFAIMNSASYNLNPKDVEAEKRDLEGVVMKSALQVCKTVDDFEELLKLLEPPMGLETNFGVIDAEGNAAYFEVSNVAYKKIDATDPKQAPHGYLIRSNHSLTGRKDDGLGYIRQQAAESIFENARNQNDLTPRFLVQGASRCLKHALTGRDLCAEAKELSDDETQFVIFRDYIPRKSSASAIVLQGVKQGEDPRLGTIWTVLGFPLTSAAVPTWVGVGPELPKILQGKKNQPAPMCSLSLQLKTICFPITRGSGPYYLNLPQLINHDETGFMQRIAPVEKRLFDKTEPMLEKWRSSGFNVPQAKEFYHWVDTEWFGELRKATLESQD